jgi:hypothetical protein
VNASRDGFLKILVAAIASVFLASCRTPPPGSIYLDHPEVFTRERLVNRRLADLEWLDSELKRQVTGSLQGAREQRSFSGLNAGLEAQFDPLGAAGSSSALQTFQSGQRITQLQNELMGTALEQKLKDLQDGKLKYADVVGSNVAPSPVSFQATNFAPLSPLPSSQWSNALPGLPSASNIVLVTDRIQPTPSEQFRDRLAYRDAVSGEMRQKELDDTHDRAGMTLYTLKFDLSVIPAPSNRFLGRAHVCISRDAKENHDRDYNAWLQSFRETFDDEVISIQRRYLQHYLTDEEQRQITVGIWDLQLKATNIGQLEQDPRRQSEASILQDLGAVSNAPPNQELTGTNRDAMLKLLCWRTVFDFAKAFPELQDLVEFEEPRLAEVYRTTENASYFLVPIDANPKNGLKAFAKLRKKLSARAKPFIYTVEPKENAQNLSDASARETARNLSLALAAAVPQAGTRANAYVNYLTRNQYLLETIKRAPLLVGFIENETNFGWIIGPRFRIGEKQSLDYEHTAVQVPVQATIAVPGWWSTVTLCITNEWLDSRGAAIKTEGPAGVTYHVRLRPDYDAITRARLESGDPTQFSSPQIYPRWNPDLRQPAYVLQVGKPAQVLILGRNLWRNPEIFIGSQGTRRYEVLPDMEGLVALFDELQPVQFLENSTDAPTRVDLRVVTSDGQAVLKDAVAIVSGRRPGQQIQSCVRLARNWGVAGSNYTFVLDTNLVPQAFHGFLLTEMGKGIGTNMDPMALQNGELIFKLPSKAAPEKSSFNVMLLTTPCGSPQSVLEGNQQELVVFTNEHQSEFILSTNSIVFSTNPSVCVTSTDIRVVPGIGQSSDLFWSAWPGIRSSIADGKGRLRLRSGQKELILEASPRQKQVDSAVFVMDAAQLLNEFKANSVKCEAAILFAWSQKSYEIPAGDLSINIK